MLGRKLEMQQDCLPVMMQDHLRVMSEGPDEGTALGSAVGCFVGASVGAVVGPAVGSIVGVEDEFPLGFAEGSTDG